MSIPSHLNQNTLTPLSHIFVDGQLEIYRCTDSKEADVLSECFSN